VLITYRGRLGMMVCSEEFRTIDVGVSGSDIAISRKLIEAPNLNGDPVFTPGNAGRLLGDRSTSGINNRPL
jgi:hypothetical protein